MDPQPDMIRQQIDQTRSSLTVKLETLEAEVKDTVQNAKDTVQNARAAVEDTLSTARDTVQDTISSVKESVHSAAESVKRTFDVEHQVQDHPWAMLGLSLLSGAALGALLGPRLRAADPIARRLAEAAYEPPPRSTTTPPAAWERLNHHEPARPGFLDKLGSQLGDELEKAKDLAITTIAGVVSDVVRRSIPAMGSAVEEMMVNAAKQCGAPPQQHPQERHEGTGVSSYQTPPAF